MAVEVLFFDVGSSLGIVNIIVHEFQKDQEIFRFFYLLILHELDVKVVFDQFQKNEAAISEHLSDFRSFDQKLFDCGEQTVQTFFICDCDQLSLKAFSLAVDVMQDLSLFLSDVWVGFVQKKRNFLHYFVFL